MSDITDLIQSRRTVRAFQDKAIPEDVMNEILEAARWTPSWANTQCWELIIVTNPKVKAALQSTVPDRNPSYEAIVKAPVLLAVCAMKEKSGYYLGEAPTPYGDWMLFDLGLLTQNIALAAHAQGLGSVVVGLFNQAEAARRLKLPEEAALVTLMPLGYPEGDLPEAPPRREIGDFTHQDGF